MKNILSDSTVTSRREALKKVGKTTAFILPTIMTFNVSELKASVSKSYDVSKITNHFSFYGSCIEGYYKDPNNVHRFYTLDLQKQKMLIEYLSFFEKRHHNIYLNFIKRLGG